MRTKVFNEDTRVKLPALIHFLRIGYKYKSLKTANVDFETKIFKDIFKNSIEKINNKTFSNSEIDNVIYEIRQSAKRNDLGKDFYKWLVNPEDKIKLIDFVNINNNDFTVVSELPFTIEKDTEEGSFRPDITVLINGMPLAFLEVKKPSNMGGIQVEFDRMVNDRLKNAAFTKFFNMFQIVSFSNNMEYEDDEEATEVRAGSFYSTPNGRNTSFSFFREDEENFHKNYDYINIFDEEKEDILKDNYYSPDEVYTDEFEMNSDEETPCNRFITSLFDKERLLYMIRYGIAYIDGEVPQKHIMRYPQFFATRNILERLETGKGGIIWHTQGSGKTALAAYSNRIIKDFYARKNINARFFFIVDRLDLLSQASYEFEARGMTVTNCTKKSDFAKELNKTLDSNINPNSTGEICVVNIHKIEDEIPQAKNMYNTNVQRIFFIDEAHRSYCTTGEFFKNLMTCDRDGMFIALTGTPILNKKERSNLKFGEYIHKYFYDKSIADGYTLRIKRENVATAVKTKVKNDIEVDERSVNVKEVFESEAYVNEISDYIANDFKEFRLQTDDNYVGGMIVCRTNNQAKAVYNRLKEHSNLKVGLVISDLDDPTQKARNKNNQDDFRNSDKIDILVVNMMLTTGYDAKRLKKMYLLRGPHAQTLLQTISRVNRPYTSPNGRKYKYGYIVDFVDITKEFDKTLEDYINELEADFNIDSDENATLDGLIIDKEDIYARYLDLSAELQCIVDITNYEAFARKIEKFDKEKLLKLRKLLMGIKDCRIEFALSGAKEYEEQIDVKQINTLLKLVNERIRFLNIQLNPVESLNVFDNENLANIMFEFLKLKTTILDLGAMIDNPDFDRVVEKTKNLSNRISKNKNRTDPKMIRLNELLKKIFDKLEMSNLDDLEEIEKELDEAITKVDEINEENDRLSKVYGGHFGFVKTIQETSEKYEVINQDKIETFMQIAYEEVKDVLDKETLDVQGRDNFVDNMKSKMTKNLVKKRIYKDFKNSYDPILGELYMNLQYFK